MKKKEAEKIGRMSSEGVNQQIAMHGYQHQPVVPQPPQVASQARPQAPNNVLNNNLIQEGASKHGQTYYFFKSKESIFKHLDSKHHKTLQYL